MRISLIVASNFYLSARFGLIELCFGYDALCYLISRAHDPMSPKCTNIFVSPKDVSQEDILKKGFLNGCLLRGRLLRGCLLKRRLLRGCFLNQPLEDVFQKDVCQKNVTIEWWQLCPWSWALVFDFQ